jgi:hypothetical protein
VTVVRRFAPFVAVLAIGCAVVPVVAVGSAGRGQAAPRDPSADAGVGVQGVGTASGTPDVLHATVGVSAVSPASAVPIAPGTTDVTVTTVVRWSFA